MPTLDELRQKVLANSQAARLLVSRCDAASDPRHHLSFLWQRDSDLARCLADASQVTLEQAAASLAAAKAEYDAVIAAYEAEAVERSHLRAPGSILDSVFAAAKEAE